MPTKTGKHATDAGSSNDRAAKKPWRTACDGPNRTNQFKLQATAKTRSQVTRHAANGQRPGTTVRIVRASTPNKTATETPKSDDEDRIAPWVAANAAEARIIVESTTGLLDLLFQLMLLVIRRGHIIRDKIVGKPGRWSADSAGDGVRDVSGSSAR